MRILTDKDIDAVPIHVFARAIEAHLIEDARGAAVAPPRGAVDLNPGKLVFTTGGSASSIGFRAYETLPGPRDADEQIVACWDRGSKKLLGLAVGERLGALRTGILGGLAVKALAPKSPSICGVIGTGLQAETQILAIAALYPPKCFRVYSRDPHRRGRFAERMSALINVEVSEVDSAKDAVEGADMVVLATDSTTEVIDAAWVAPGAHLTTVGPKTKTAHELPIALADRAAAVFSDSPQQIEAQEGGHMLSDHSSAANVSHLGDALSDPAFRRPNGLTLFLSAGIAGSEVVALRAALEHDKHLGVALP